jgi:phosphatidate phosphatase PAH1
VERWRGVDRRQGFAALALGGAFGCGSGSATDEAPCVPQAAVYTDIDETLTTLDAEWTAQLLDPSHDPAMRPDADALMQDYAELGYTVVYLTARGEEVVLADGRSARQATADWLDAHGFPWSDADLYLAPGLGAAGDSAVDYKAGVLDDRTAAGWSAAWAYGNATSDIEAFRQAGIPDAQIFLVGALVGTLGAVNDIPDDDAYAAHRASQLPAVVPADCASTP